MLHRTFMATVARTIVLILVTGFFLFSADTLSAKTVTGSGSAVIEDDDLRTAAAEAEAAALTDALRTVLQQQKEELGEASMPEVTEEFFKFIQHYRILERRVKDFTVTYHIEAAIDEVALSDVAFYVDTLVNSAVYALFGIDNETDRSRLNTRLAENLHTFHFSTSPQQDFNNELPTDPDRRDVRTTFARFRAGYLFEFDIDPDYERTGDVFSCEVAVTARVRSKEQSFTPMKITARGFEDSRERCLVAAVDKGSQTLLDYVRNELIRLPERTTEHHTFPVMARNFSNFVMVNNFFDILKNRKYISEMNIETFATDRAVFTVTSSFSPAALIEKLDTLTEQHRFTYSRSDDGILLDFANADEPAPEPDNGTTPDNVTADNLSN